MNVYEALSARHSTRAFLDRLVDIEKIERLLRYASRSPSGSNTQPWKVAVVTGKTKAGIENKIIERFRSGDRGKPDYQYYPVRWAEPYKSRRFACGMQLYSSVGVALEDRQGRNELWIRNYASFGAPVVLFVYMENGLETGSYMDMGMFIQSIMLGALHEGLATCPQAALAEFPDLVKSELQLAADTVLLCGISVGYEDANAAINRYRTPRADLDQFVTFHS